MLSLPLKTLQTIASLQRIGIDPVLYGSQGVSLYIGAFKQFGDIDLLVEDRWIKVDWDTFITVMQGLGFTLQDEREHEFIDSSNTQVAFAGISILVRDGIAPIPSAAIQDFIINGTTVRTLTPEAFLKAYEFSAQDGYRRDAKGKKDREVIDRITEYLSRS